MQQLVRRSLLSLFIIQLFCLFYLHSQYQLLLVNRTYNAVIQRNVGDVRRLPDRGRITVELIMKYPTVEEVIQNLKKKPLQVCDDIRELGIGRKVCLDSGLLASRNRCVAYSFSTRKTDMSVERQLAAICRVYIFNPTLSSDQVSNSTNIHLFSFGLGAEGESRDRYGKRLLSYGSILAQLEHYQRNLDYVFLDVQGTEAKILKEIIRHGHLRYIKQLSITFSLGSLQQKRKFFKDVDYILNEIEERRMIRYSSESLPSSFAFLPVLKQKEETVYILSWFNVVFREPYARWP